MSPTAKATAAVQPVMDMELREAAPVTPAPTVSSDTMAMMQLIERMSLDERIDPAKMREIFGLKRDLDADKAKREFQIDFAAMSERLPVITKDGHIKNREGKVQSRYAKYENIQRVVKPILREFGFTMNHEQNPETSAEMVLATFLIHRGGHSQRSVFRAKTDTSGSKNDIQGLGSAASYAKRYNTIALLDLQVEADDDDGQKAGQMTEPAGFSKWLEDMQSASMDGVKALTDAWQAAPKAFKDFIRVKDFESMKLAARGADKAAGRG